LEKFKVMGSYHVRNVNREKGLGRNQRKVTEGICVGNTVVRKGRKGKTRRGMLMRIRKEMMEKDKVVEIVRERMIIGRVKMGKQR